MHPEQAKYALQKNITREVQMWGGIRMTIGERLRALRKLKERETGAPIICREVAKDIDVSPSAMYMYERGRRVPPADRLVALADYYDVTVDYILGRDVDSKSTTSDSQAERNRRLERDLLQSGASDEDIRFIMDLLQRRRILRDTES